MTRFILPDDQLPTAWFNLLPRLPMPLDPPLHPGTREPVGPDDLAPLFPMALIGQEMSRRAVDRHPRRGARHPQAVAPDAAGAGRAARGRAGHAGPHLLQGRVGVAGRLAQAQHRGAAGVLQQAGGHHPADHRDRRRPVGLGAVVRLRPVRPRVHGLHGAGVVRAEALPQGDDGALGRRGRAVAGRRSRQPRLARRRHHRRGARLPCTRDDSHYALGSVLNHVLLHQTIIGLEAKEQLGHGRGERSRRRDRLVRRRLEPRRHLLPVRARRATCGWWRSSRRRARRSPRAASSTTSATWPA